MATTAGSRRQVTKGEQNQVAVWGRVPKKFLSPMREVAGEGEAGKGGRGGREGWGGVSLDVDDMDNDSIPKLSRLLVALLVLSLVVNYTFVSSSTPLFSSFPDNILSAVRPHFLAMAALLPPGTLRRATSYSSSNGTQRQEEPEALLHGPPIAAVPLANPTSPRGLKLPGWLFAQSNLQALHNAAANGAQPAQKVQAAQAGQSASLDSASSPGASGNKTLAAAPATGAVAGESSKAEQAIGGAGSKSSKAAWALLNKNDIPMDSFTWTTFPGPELCGHWSTGYTSLHKRIRAGQGSGKYLVFQPQTSGLGDNLNGMVSAFLGALLSGRAFVMKPYLWNDALDMAEINWAITPADADNASTQFHTSLEEETHPRGGGNLVLRRLNGKAVAREHVTFPNNVLEYFQLLENFTTITVHTNGGVLAKIWQIRGPTWRALQALGLRLPYAFGCIVRYLVKPKAELLTRIQHPLSVLHAPHSKDTTMCLHLRTTDAFAFNGQAQAERMQVALNVAEAMVDCANRLNVLWSPASRLPKWLFLADSLELARLLQQRHQDKIVISEWTPEHVTKKSKDAMISAVGDWLVFSSCDFYILGESGFSKTSAAYNYLTPFRVILPTRWEEGFFSTEMANSCKADNPSSLKSFNLWSGL